MRAELKKAVQLLQGTEDAVIRSRCAFLCRIRAFRGRCKAKNCEPRLSYFRGLIAGKVLIRYLRTKPWRANQSG